MRKGLFLLFPVIVVALLLLSLFAYFNLKSGRSILSNPTSFKGFENCMRDIAETIPRYKNAKDWNLKSSSSQSGLDGSASARIYFTTDDSEENVFAFYKRELSQNGWEELDDSVYQFSTTQQNRDHSLTFQKIGVVYLSSPLARENSNNSDFIIKVAYCKAFK